MSVIYLDQTVYDGCDFIGTISRSSGQIPGLNKLSVSIELPIDVELPKNVRIISCKLSEDTANRIDFATGFYLGASAKPVANDTKFLWTFEIADVLYFLSNSKPIINYKNTTTVLGHARDLAVLAERTNPGNVGYRYLDIQSEPDSEPFLLDLTGDTYNLATAYEELKKASGYEFVVQEVGWANPEALFNTPGSAITRLLFRPIGSNTNLAPIPVITYDPTSPTFCQDFPLTDFTFSFSTQAFSSVRFIGKNGTKAKDLGETLQTSYSERLSFLIRKPSPVAGVTDFQLTLVLPNEINELNQVLLTAPTIQLAVVEPYDPNGTLNPGECYFDRASNPPKIVFRSGDVNAFTDDKTCYALVNYVFIQVEETNSAQASQLSAGTHGAIAKSYEIIKNESVSDFPIATEAALVRLEQITKLKFNASGKRRTTTENWLNEQTVIFNIPSQGFFNILTKVSNANATLSGKVSESTLAGELRDEIIYNSLTFTSVDTLFANVKNRLAPTTRPALPTYREVPYTAPPTLCPIFNVTGNFSGDYNIYYLTTSDPNYSVLTGAGINVDSANQTLSYPLSKAGSASFSIDLTNVDYANVPSLYLNIASVININSTEYNPRLFYTDGINTFPAILGTITVPPGQQLQLNYEAGGDLFDNFEAISTRNLPFPLYAGFPSPSSLFMQFLARVNIIVDPQDLPPEGTYARLEMQVSFGGTTFIDEWIQVEADGTTTGSSNAGSTFTDSVGGSAEAYLGTTQQLELRLFIHRPSLKYNIDPLFIALGNLDGLLNRVLNFPFPDPPDDPPTIGATHKVFIQDIETVSLEIPTGAETDSRTIDLTTYLGQVVEVRLETALDIDQISNYVVQGEIRTDMTINCVDIEGPDPGGGGSGGSGGS